MFLMAVSREVYRYMHVIQPSIFFRLFVCLLIVHACLYRTDDSSVCDCSGDIMYTVETLSTLSSGSCQSKHWVCRISQSTGEMNQSRQITF